MSLILEALKKSEANRRLGEAPDLGTPFATRPAQRSALPFLPVLIVAALGIGWWLWRAPATSTAPAVVSEGNPAPAGKPAAGAAKPKAVATAPTEHNIATDKPWIKRGFGMEQPLPPPTPVQAAPTTPPAATPPRPAPPVQTVAAAPAPPPQPAAQPVITPTPPVRTENRTPPPPEPKAPVAAQPVDASTPAVRTENRAPPPAGTPAPKKADLPPPSAPTYVDLPFSVRKDIPAPKLSMHVYSADPASRFVLINNVRLGEGEKQDDLLVREIRPDGVILEVKGQAFFYPREGL